MDQIGDSSAAAATQPPELAIEQTSATFVARWNHLVSTTNWEKGRIVSQWRAALVESSASPQEYSDEAWSRRLQAVSPQHVGRLRRVWERFGQVCTDYDRLYWSHFQAALDWPDAEMWLEGAVQNEWSISAMRAQRAAAVAEATGQAPVEEADVEYDNPSADPADSLADEARDESVAADSSERTVRPVADQMDDLEDDEESDSDEDADAPWDEQSSSATQDDSRPAAAETVRPFASLAELPADLADAFESFKLAILRHKVSGWTEIGSDDVLNALDALKELTLAPSE